MKEFIWGLLAMSNVVVAIFFLHYWRMSRDRFFAFFSIAFAAMAADWVAHAVFRLADPHRAVVYLARLFAFIVILVAIIDKNRQARRR